MDLPRLRASEDAYVDDLFRPAVDYGATLISAVAPRAYVDLNRDPADLDPNLLDGAGARMANARVVAGLGVVPRVVAEGVAIYDGKLPIEEARRRIERWHTPYHRKLSELLGASRRRFGRALLIDCHSMPSDLGGAARKHQAQVVLGDRFGVAADRFLVEAVEHAFVTLGFRVARNTPFAGGYITERYGRPVDGVSAIQIEIDRSLYLDQRRVAPSHGFDALRRSLTQAIADIAGLIGESPQASALAAE